jgi:hypothetical protein
VMQEDMEEGEEREHIPEPRAAFPVLGTLWERPEEGGLDGDAGLQADDGWDGDPGGPGGPGSPEIGTTNPDVASSDAESDEPEIGRGLCFLEKASIGDSFARLSSPLVDGA